MRMMAEHKLQFPEFQIVQYPQRWRAYHQGSSSCGYWIMEDEPDGVVGYAGYMVNGDGTHEIVGVAVRKDRMR